MRGRSGSAVQVEQEKKNRVSLRKRPNPEAGPPDAIAAAGTDESTLIREERAWLEGRLVIGLEKTRNILEVFDNDSLADDDVFDAILEMKTLEEVLAGLNGKGDGKKKKEESVAARAFRSVFSAEAWAELEASDQAVVSGDESQLRMLRLERRTKITLEDEKRGH